MYCEFCGQEITDASGEWVLEAIDRSLNRQPEERVTCCSWCKDGINDLLKDFQLKQYRLRKELGIRGR